VDQTQCYSLVSIFNVIFSSITYKSKNPTNRVFTYKDIEKVTRCRDSTMAKSKETKSRDDHIKQLCNNLLLGYSHLLFSCILMSPPVGAEYSTYQYYFHSTSSQLDNSILLPLNKLTTRHTDMIIA